MRPSLFAGRGIALILAALLALPAVVRADAGDPLPPDQAAIKGHVQFLASDALRGREAGTRDYDVAAEYVASQMLAMGLRPAGNDGSWFQPVKVASFRPSAKAKWTLTRGDSVVPLQFGMDFVNQAAPATPDFKAEGGVVFAGYGIVYAAGKRDDYKGLDVRGKIVALLPGVPSGLPNEIEAHFGDDDQKARLAQTRGAKAVIILESAARRAEMPFEAAARYWDWSHSGWAAPDGTVHVASPGAPVVGYVSQAGAAKLFQGARIKWSDVLAAELRGGRIPTGALPGTLAVATQTRTRFTASSNVIGMIPGSDPALRDQYVVLSAHLDHVGLGNAENGDRIYNGAMDNAVGVSMILEIARRLSDPANRPRRSILVVALTAEEKGLIGSSYLASNPVAGGKMVADINLDMPILSYPLVDLVALGGERSSLGPVIAAAAKAEGLAVVPDPAPEEMFFVRSDHYSFVQAGIPAVSVDSGPGGAGEKAQRDFLATRYHKPSDDIRQPFDWASAAKFMRVNLAATRALADADARPAWNKGDFFGTLFNGYGAQ